MPAHGPPSEPRAGGGSAPGGRGANPSEDGLQSILRGLAANSQRIQEVLARLQELQRLLFEADETQKR